jgi:hypothetical protein
VRHVAVENGVVAGWSSGAYPGRVPLSAVLLPTRPRPRPPSRRVLGELGLGLLLGVVGGWVAGLVRVRRP